MESEIVAALTINDLDRIVNAMRRKGWRPHGPRQPTPGETFPDGSKTSTIWRQLMVKDEELTLVSPQL